MMSKLLLGQVHHQRVAPVAHEFGYPIAACSFDLAELESLGERFSWFSYNARSWISIHDEDYLSHASGPILTKLQTLLRETGVSRSFSRFELITVPRVIKKVFNPVSFYLCYDETDRLSAAVAEVNNTFGEAHVYVLDNLKSSGEACFDQGLVSQKHTNKQNFGRGESPGFLSARCCKEFHVSPFNGMKGEYRFYFCVQSDHLDIRVNIRLNEQTVFTSRLSGTPYPLQSVWHLPTLGKLAYSAHSAMPRIMWEAAKLRYGKGLRVYSKPIASSTMTIRRRGPGLLQGICMKATRSYLSKLTHGDLTLAFPDGTRESFGDAQSPLKATLSVKNYNLFVSSILRGDVGFGEAFVKGYWEADDLTSLLKIFVENAQCLPQHDIGISGFARRLNSVVHRWRKNSKQRSGKHVRAHYDLSNELFERFLDPTMTYSCARFEADDDDLEQAQRNKLLSMIRKARISAQDHVLEIGSGWGSFAIEAARSTGCRVTSITLSPEQQRLALERVRAAGLEDKISIELCDYRDLKGSYDKIVSIEMLEAVGHQYLGTFFKVCDGLLKDNGLLVLQFISIPDQRYHRYRKGCDFIQKYVFPGGHCPSLSAVASAAAKHSRFVIEDMENIGIHYARTLFEWRTRFMRNLREISSMGFDEEFQRIWSYYFSYCEAGFATRTLGTLQMVLTRPNNKTL